MQHFAKNAGQLREELGRSPAAEKQKYVENRRKARKAGENLSERGELEKARKWEYRKQDTGGNKLGMVIQHSAAVFACVKAVKNSVAIW